MAYVSINFKFVIQFCMQKSTRNWPTGQAYSPFLLHTKHPIIVDAADDICHLLMTYALAKKLKIARLILKHLLVHMPHCTQVPFLCENLVQMPKQLALASFLQQTASYRAPRRLCFLLLPPIIMAKNPKTFKINIKRNLYMPPCYSQPVDIVAMLLQGI